MRVDVRSLCAFSSPIPIALATEAAAAAAGVDSTNTIYYAPRPHSVKHVIPIDVLACATIERNPFTQTFITRNTAGKTYSSTCFDFAAIVTTTER